MIVTIVTVILAIMAVVSVRNDKNGAVDTWCLCKLISKNSEKDFPWLRHGLKKLIAISIGGA